MSDADPLVMYLVARESLNMSPGKLAAQVGHGVQHVLAAVLLNAPTTFAHVRPRLLQWLAGDYRKVVLRASDAEWGRLKDLNPAAIVTDDGHTEVNPGTETVLAFWPMRKSERPSLLKRLRVL